MILEISMTNKGENMSITKSYLEEKLEKIIKYLTDLSENDENFINNTNILVLLSDLTDLKNHLEHTEINEWYPVEYNWDLYSGYGGKKLPNDGETVLATIGNYCVIEVTYIADEKIFAYIDATGYTSRTREVRAWTYKPKAYGESDSDIENETSNSELTVKVPNKKKFSFNLISNNKLMLMVLISFLIVVFGIILSINGF